MQAHARIERKNQVRGASVLVVGTGGVGCAIAASIAAEGVAKLLLSDTNTASAEALAGRLKQHYPKMETGLHSNDPTGFDLVVNATPLGMKKDDPYPIDVKRLTPSTSWAKSS